MHQLPSCVSLHPLSDLRDMRDSHAHSLTPANEALLFSIYYAAVTSMEEDDVSFALFEFRPETITYGS